MTSDLFNGARNFFHLPHRRLPLMESNPRIPKQLGGDGFRRFATNEEAQKYGDRMLGDTVDHLPADQHRAVSRYTRHSWPYTSIQRAEHPQEFFELLKSKPKLRSDLLELYDGRLPTLSEIRDDTALLNEATSRPLPGGIELHRSLSSISFMKNYDGADPRSLAGTLQATPAPMSASLGDPPYNLFRLHLLAPPGQHGLWIGRLSSHPDQREFLLPGDTDYHIKEAIPGPKDSWDMHGKLIP